MAPRPDLILENVLRNVSAGKYIESTVAHKTPFRKKRYQLNKMSKWKASKCAIFYV